MWHVSALCVPQVGKVMIKVRQATGQDVPVAQLFRTPTIASLAEALERSDGRAVDTAQAIPRAGYTPEQRAAGVPCSANQEQMVVLIQMHPGSAAYNMAEPVRLRGKLDVALLEAALGYVVRRHETLRTYFVEEDGQVLQAVLPVDDPRAAPQLQRHSLPSNGSAAELQLQALVDKLREQPYQLTGAGVMTRYHLIALGEDDHVLFMGMHHILR